LGFGAPATVAEACDRGLLATATDIEGQITQIAFDQDTIRLAGTATITDTDEDLLDDQITGGQWTGVVSVGGATTTLSGLEDRFAGTRLP
jgi:hypothetical protein